MAKKNKSCKNTLGGFAVGAVKSGQEGLIQVLMLAGISPDHKCKDGKSLAHHAAEYAVAVGDPDVLRKLVDYGANLYLKDSKGRTVVDILKASPKLEAEARAEWLRGSRQLGIKDTPLSKTTIKRSKKREAEIPHDDHSNNGRIREGVSKLRVGSGKIRRVGRPVGTHTKEITDEKKRKHGQSDNRKIFEDNDATSVGH